MNLRPFVLIGAINAFLAVAFGAFGAHGLRDIVPPDRLAVYHTGAQYHMYHALGLLLIAPLGAGMSESRWLRASGWLLTAGIVVFAGSLYLLAITGVRWLGAITPLGGVCFLSGWVCLAVAAVRGGKR